MARVLEVQEGRDGRVRFATVVTKDGKLKRPVVKLAALFYESVFREKTGPGEPLIQSARNWVHIQWRCYPNCSLETPYAIPPLGSEELTARVFSEKVFIQLTNSFIPNNNTWENTICSLSQQESILKKDVRYKSC